MGIKSFMRRIGDSGVSSARHFQFVLGSFSPTFSPHGVGLRRPHTTSAAGERSTRAMLCKGCKIKRYDPSRAGETVLLRRHVLKFSVLPHFLS
jgi:hypothetical protein